MNIESPRFGTLRIEASKIIEFPQGLSGFESNKRFTLFHPENQEPKFFILQSVDDPDLAFQIVDPTHFGFNYEIALNDAETDLLKLVDPHDAVVAVIIWKDETGEPNGPLRANLKAPLIINTRERRGLQHVFMKLDCTLTGS